MTQTRKNLRNKKLRKPNTVLPSRHKHTIIHKGRRVVIPTRNPVNTTTIRRAKYSNGKHVGGDGSPPVYATPHPQRPNHSPNTLALFQQIANQGLYGDVTSPSQRGIYDEPVPKIITESNFNLYKNQGYFTNITYDEFCRQNPARCPKINLHQSPIYNSVNSPVNPVESAYNNPRRPIHNPINSRSYTKPVTLNKSKFMPEFYELVENFRVNIKKTLNAKILSGNERAKQTFINYIELLEKINTMLQDPKKTKIILDKDEASNYNRLYFNINRVDYKFPIASILWNKTTKQSPSKQQNYTTIINRLLRYKEILEKNMTGFGVNFNRF